MNEQQKKRETCWNAEDLTYKIYGDTINPSQEAHRKACEVYMSAREDCRKTKAEAKEIEYSAREVRDKTLKEILEEYNK